MRLIAETERNSAFSELAQVKARLEVVEGAISVTNDEREGLRYILIESRNLFSGDKYDRHDQRVRARLSRGIEALARIGSAIDHALSTSQSEPCICSDVPSLRHLDENGHLPQCPAKETK